MTKTAGRLALLFAVLGLGASAASTLVHYRLLGDPTYLSFCDVNATFNCSQVYQSRFGYLGGIPVALFGLLWSVIMLALVVVGLRGPNPAQGNAPGYLFVLATAGLAFVLYLGYVSLVVLKTICLLCVGVYAAVIGLFLVAGRATSFPLASLPKRAVADLRRLVASPVALFVSLLLLTSAASAVALFPRDPSGGQVAPPSADRRAAFEQWWSERPRVPVMVPSDGAAVVIVKFNDYQCPPCRQTYEIYKGILAKYEAARVGGRKAVKVISADFPLDPECNAHAPTGTHLAACEAAVAVRLARARQRGEALEEWLFANQPSLTPEAVREAARRVGLVSDFGGQYERTLELVRADIALGQTLGVLATPTFFINGVKLEGGLQPEFLDLAIAYELKRVSQ